MQITPNLDIDNDIENLATGTLVQASNIVSNITNAGIMTENSIGNYFDLNAGEKVVGKIACSDEFVVFTNQNRIIRVKESNDKNTYESATPIITNWEWGGGEVIGCYTYNVKNELVVCISERIDYEEAKVPVKIINLDNPNYNAGSTDNQYVIAPEIPHYNMYSFEFVAGNTIPKGIYVFFIRFKRGEDYTTWFPLGVPVELFTKDNIQTVYSGYECAKMKVERIPNRNGQPVGVPKDRWWYALFYPYAIQDYVTDTSENVGYNIRVTLGIELQSIPYEKYQIGYIVNTIKGESIPYTTNDYDIDVTEFIADCTEHDVVTVDELTSSAINIYNAHTMCNYNNRVYAANYWEENPNINVPNIDVSGITVTADAYTDVDFIGNMNVETGRPGETNTVSTRTTKAQPLAEIEGQDVTEDFTEINNKYNYLVELNVNFNKQDGTKQSVNVRLHCTRFCYHDDRYQILIGVNDLMHAIAMETGLEMVNCYAGYIPEGTSVDPYDAKFIAIDKYVDVYQVRLVVDYGKVLLNYPYSWDSVANYSKYIFDDNNYPSNVNWQNFVLNKDDYHTTTQYYDGSNLPMTLGYSGNDGDIIVTKCTQFTGEVARDAINPTWFYDGVIKYNGTEYRTVASYGGNNCSETVGQANIPNTNGSYNAHLAYNLWIVKDPDFISNIITQRYPDYTIERWWERQESPDGTDSKSTEHSFSNSTNDYVTVAYNSWLHQFMFVRVTPERIIPIYDNIECSYWYEDDDGGHTEYTEINANNLNLNWEEDRANDTLEDLIVYYDGIKQSKYVWREDRQPTDADFNLDDAYNGLFGKQNPTYYASEGDSDPSFKIYNRQAIAVGFRNPTESGDTITVDKDFCFVVQLDEFLKAYPSSDGAFKPNYKPDYGDEVRVEWNGTETHEGYYERYYILFRKQDTTTYGGETILNGHFCYLAEDCTLESEVPYLEELFDFSCPVGSLPQPYETLPRITNLELGTSYQFLGCAKFYANTITTDSITTFNNLQYGGEYVKCAINNAVYNFFIHYLLPDGNYTDGIKIEPNITYNKQIRITDAVTYDCDETTTIGDIKTYCEANGISDGFNETDKINTYFELNPSIRICNLFPHFVNGVSLYINNEGDKFFRGNAQDAADKINTVRPIRFYFDNIPQPTEYVGYFISYEKPEHILIGTGPVVGSVCTDGRVEAQLQEIKNGTNELNEPTDEVPSNYPLDFNSEYIAEFSSVRFYCSEFNILKKGRGVNQLVISEYGLGGDATRTHESNMFYTIDGRFDTGINNVGQTIGVNECNIIVPDDRATNNGGREGCIGLNFNGSILVGQTTVQDITTENYNSKLSYFLSNFGCDTIMFQLLYGPDAYLREIRKYEALKAGIADNTKHYLTIGSALKHTNIYSKRNKELISLGYIKYYDENANYGYQDFPYNYDYHYNKSVSAYCYHRYGCMYDEVDYRPRFVNRDYASESNYPSYYVCFKYNEHNKRYYWYEDDTTDNERRGIVPFIQFTYPCYNEFNWNCVKFDQEPIEHYYTVQDLRDGSEAWAIEGQDISTLYTKYVYPLYVNDLFTIDTVYKGVYLYKLITNYDSTNYANYLEYYGKTIRRSQVISDESIENRWRIWRLDAYKMIDENKGNIMNVIGVGRYLMAHCEHSLFVFDRSNQLDASNDSVVQTLMPDPFDIDYTEVFTADKGYAGLQSFHQWSLSNFGYAFFDSDAKRLYNFDENNLNDLTNGFKNLFIHTTDLRMATEEDNMRLIICGTVDLNPAKYTISYHFGHKEWLSTHTYWFEDLFNTKSAIYFINNDRNVAGIDGFKDGSYLNYNNALTDETNYYKSEYIDGKPASYVDMLFNNNGIDKVLDYISYRINKATDDQYSGDKLLIYTNCCYSDYKDVSTPRRRVDDWKSPVYRFGIWVVNWFRNWIKPIPTVHPIIRGNGKFDNNAGELGKQVNNNALMVGKFWVVRLIFRDDSKRISVDDIQTY